MDEDKTVIILGLSKSPKKKSETHKMARSCYRPGLHGRAKKFGADKAKLYEPH